MYFVDNNSGVPVMPSVKPVSSATPQYFTEGGNGVPPTYPGPDWFNIIQTEILNILKEAGISPDKANHAQMLAAMKLLFAANTASLGALAALTGAANKLPYFTGPKGAAITDLTQVGRDIIGKATVDDVLKYLQLGEAAKLNVGTTTGTVAAGDDLRISGAIQKNNNLSDLPNKATARANLGLGSSAVAGIGNSAGNVAPGNVTFGISQTWKNVSSQREYGVLYTNSSTRPIVICLRVEIPASTTITLEVDNITTDGFNSTSNYSQEGFLFSIVPPGVAYRALRIRGSSQNILSWVELS